MEGIKFGFIIHPSDEGHFKRVMRKVSDKRLARITSAKGNSQMSITALNLSLLSNSGTAAECEVMFYPQLPEQMIANEAQAVSGIIESIKCAQERGVRFVGLGGFTSIIGNGGLDIANNVSLPVTSGNTYTASAVVQSILNIGKSRSMDFSKMCMTVIGATGDIGSACAKGLARLFGKTILVARNDDKLEKLAHQLQTSSVFLEKKSSKGATQADVVITVTSSLTTLIHAKDLKKHAIVCDVSYPANVAKEIHKERPDILVFEGGIVSSEQIILQIEPKSLFWEFNPQDGMHACFAETLLLALEGNLTNYCIGRGFITQQKMQEIAHVAEMHGFHPLLSWGSSGHIDKFSMTK